MIRIRWIVLCIIICMGLCTVCIAASPNEQEGDPSITIAIDPGHGGEEDGAEYYGLKEKNIDLRLAKIVKAGLEKYDNVTVIMTRESDEDVGLEERVIRAKEAGADIFLSIHCNASVSHLSHGAQVYVTTAEAYRKELMDFADYFMGEFEALGLDNAGVFSRVTQLGRRRADGTFDDYYGVLRHSYNHGMPAMIVEHCYMDSAEDVHYVKNTEGLEKLAQADVNAIAAYYGLTDKEGKHVNERHAKVYGGTTKAIELGYYDAPRITGIELSDYNGISPGIAKYRISIEDEVGVSYIYLVYKAASGGSVTVPMIMGDPLTTGTYELTGLIPHQLNEGDYTLSYIGLYNIAGYDAGYNYSSGYFVGFGKCDWLNEFNYSGEANLAVHEQGKLYITHVGRIEKMFENKTKKIRKPICKIGFLSN